MKNGLLILAYLLATLTRFIRPGGTKSVAVREHILEATTDYIEASDQ